MPGQPAKITPIQVLYRAFPGAVRFVAQQMTRVNTIVSTRGDREDRLGELVRRALTRRIRAELNRRHAHDTQRQARRAARAEPRPGGPAPAEGGQPGPGLPELVMPGGFADQPRAAADEPEEEDGPERTAVAGRELSLSEVDDDATVRTRVFPRSAHCRRCDHFLLLDPSQVPASLQCPCCHRAELRVEPIVFICCRCADIRELVPPLGRQ